MVPIEELRKAALKLAIEFHSVRGGATLSSVLSTAKKFEKYLQTGNES